MYKRYINSIIIIIIIIKDVYAKNCPICTVGLYVRLCLMIFLCPFLHCKALRTAMYKRYINSIIIIIIISIPFATVPFTLAK